MTLPRPSRSTLAAILLSGTAIAWGGQLVPEPYRHWYAWGLLVAATVFLMALAWEETR